MKLYRPANGTEGIGFAESFCCKCAHDHHYQTTGEAAWGCPIALWAFISEPNEDTYPNQWRYDEDGKPTCLGFSATPISAEDDPRDVALLEARRMLTG